MFITRLLSIFWTVLFVGVGIYWPNQSKGNAPTNLDDIMAAVTLCGGAICFLVFLLTFAVEDVVKRYLTSPR